MRLVFAGTPDVAVSSVNRLARFHEIVAVITRPPAPQGRSSRLVASEVQVWAENAGIEVLCPASLRDPSLLERLHDLAPECCPMVAYGGLITPALLDVPVHGWVNLHFSLLPKYRGAAPVQRALLAGDTITGVTTFRVVKELDAGPVYWQVPVDVGEGETAGDLLTRLSRIGAEALAGTMEALDRGVQPTGQSENGVSLAPKIEVAEARLDVNDSCQAFVNRVRAMSPHPGAWAVLGDERFKILRAQVATDEDMALVGVDEPTATPGDLYASKHALFVRTGDGWVRLVEVQPAGKKPMDGASWARGVAVKERCLA